MPTAAPENDWVSVASSADGSKLVAAAVTFTGGIYTSADSGRSWAASTASSDLGVWSSVASSADGIKLVAAAASVDLSGGVYISTNSRLSWTLTSAPRTAWTSVSCSADGSTMAAAAWGDAIYVSTNSGLSWFPTTSPRELWTSLAFSPKGAELMAVGGPSYTDIVVGAPYFSTPFPENIYLSPDLGATWVSDAPAGAWLAVAASADGKGFVAVGNGLVAVLRPPAPTPPAPLSPRLSVGLSGTNLILNWLIPSTSFLLQQSSDLSSPNWATVTNPPSLNFNNLHQEVTLTLKSNRSFYRLKQR
jgi:hypothetical protein